jgi:DNA (cytosine-5)-methyltransferase 1
MRLLDLFSGIGGFSLGLERAGFTTVAFCEVDPFCRKVLRKHWPKVPIYDDVRALTADRLRADGISVDAICGGFPCQDISHAAGAKARGLAGERSGLWFEMFRLIRECRPAWVIVENVPRLRTLGIDRVLDDLEGAGYTVAPPMVVGAVHAGAPHIRRRVWIVAADTESLKRRGVDAPAWNGTELACGTVSNADTLAIRQQPGRGGWTCGAGETEPALARAHANCQGKPIGTINEEVARLAQSRIAVADAGGVQLEVGQGIAGNDRAQQPSAERSPARLRPWQDGPFDGDPVVDGFSEDVDDALKAYGNAVVPQIPELIGRAILAAEAA